MNNDKKKTYIIMGVAVYSLMLLVGFHINSAFEAGASNLFAAFNVALTELASNPLNMNFSFKAFFIVTGIFGFCALWFYFTEVAKKGLMIGKEHGTAKWNTNYKAFNKQYNDPFGSPENTGKENFILSQNVFLGMNTFKTRFNNNVIVIGGSGAGKSRFFVKPNLLQANCNYVITDPAGELLENTGEFLRDKGYEVKIFNLTEMQKSLCYNPFHYIRDDEGVLTMIDCLITNTDDPNSKGGDQFWKKSEIALLEALCMYLKDYCKPEDRNFANVMKLLRAAEVDENNPDKKSPLDSIFDDVYKKDPNSLAYKSYLTFKMGAGKTLKSILISCAVRLQVFDLPAVTNLTGVDNIHLEEMGLGKKALFVITPQASSTYNFLVSMLYSQLFETLYYLGDTDKPKLQRQVRFLLDEFVNIGQIPQFTKKLATMRKYGISCSIILQNISQIKSLYKDDWETMIGNCDSMVFLGGLEYSTLEYISKILGTMTIKTQSSSKSTGKGGGSLNRQSSQRNLLNPDELGKMKNDHCVVVIRSKDPFMDFKYDYEKHPNYSETGDADKSKKFVNENDNSRPLSVQRVCVDEMKNRYAELSGQTFSGTNEQFDFTKFLRKINMDKISDVFANYQVVKNNIDKSSVKEANVALAENVVKRLGAQEIIKYLKKENKDRLMQMMTSGNFDETMGPLECAESAINTLIENGELDVDTLINEGNGEHFVMRSKSWSN